MALPILENVAEETQPSRRGVIRGFAAAGAVMTLALAELFRTAAPAQAAPYCCSLLVNPPGCYCSGPRHWEWWYCYEPLFSRVLACAECVNSGDLDCWVDSASDSCWWFV